MITQLGRASIWRRFSAVGEKTIDGHTIAIMVLKRNNVSNIQTYVDIIISGQ